MDWIASAVLALALGAFFIIATKGKSKLGISLKTVYCPRCKTKQPWLRMPANTKQLLFGGTTCPKCGANLDKYGEVIT